MRAMKAVTHFWAKQPQNLGISNVNSIYANSAFGLRAFQLSLLRAGVSQAPPQGETPYAFEVGSRPRSNIIIHVQMTLQNHKV